METKASEPVRLAAEAAAVKAASPDVYQVAQAAGTQVVEMPNGELRAYYRRGDRSQHENDEAARRVMGMMAGRVAKANAVSEARESRRATVTVKGPDGHLRPIPAEREQSVARKATFRPVIHWGRPSRMFRDGAWYVRQGQDWVEETK